MRHTRCPPTVSQSTCCRCHGERKQGGQTVPGCDEHAGTRPSGSIFGGLFPHSIFAVRQAGPSVGVGTRIAWNRSPSAGAGCINSNYTHLLECRANPNPGSLWRNLLILSWRNERVKGVCRSDRSSDGPVQSVGGWGWERLCVCARHLILVNSWVALRKFFFFRKVVTNLTVQKVKSSCKSAMPSHMTVLSFFILTATIYLSQSKRGFVQLKMMRQMRKNRDPARLLEPNTHTQWSWTACRALPAGHKWHITRSFYRLLFSHSRGRIRSICILWQCWATERGTPSPPSPPQKNIINEPLIYRFFLMAICSVCPPGGRARWRNVNIFRQLWPIVVGPVLDIL